MLETSPEKRGAAVNGLIALAPRLESEQIKFAWTSFMATIAKSKDKEAIQAATDVILALAPQLGPQQVQSAATEFIESVQRSSGDRRLSLASDLLKSACALS